MQRSGSRSTLEATYQRATYFDKCPIICCCFFSLLLCCICSIWSCQHRSSLSSLGANWTGRNWQAGIEKPELYFDDVRMNKYEARLTVSLRFPKNTPESEGSKLFQYRRLNTACKLYLTFKKKKMKKKRNDGAHGMHRRALMKLSCGNVFWVFFPVMCRIVSLGFFGSRRLQFCHGHWSLSLNASEN